jgi:tetratricopeptide (TPR) repeat protein
MSPRISSKIKNAFDSRFDDLRFDNLVVLVRKINKNCEPFSPRICLQSSYGILLVLFLCAFVGTAHDDNLEELFHNSLRKGEYVKAKGYADIYLKMATKKFGEEHPITSLAYYYKGQSYYENADFFEAKKAYKSALLIAEKHFGPLNQRVVPILFGLAKVGIALGQHEVSKSLVLRGLEVANRSKNISLTEIAEGQYLLAKVAADEGKTEEATVFAKECLGSARLLELRPNRSLIDCLEGVGILSFLVEKNRTEAETLLREALSIAEKEYGKEHPVYADILTSFAQFNKITGDFERAMQGFDSAMDIMGKKVGRGHPRTFEITLGQAEINFQRGNYNSAVASLLELKELVGNSVFKKKNIMISVLIQLSNNYLMQAKYRKAIHVLVEARKIVEARGDNQKAYHGTILQNLALANNDLGEHEISKNLYAKALAVEEEHHGPEHANVGLVLANFGLVVAEHGDRSKALKLLQRARHIFSGYFDENHPKVLQLDNSIASILSEQGRYSEALKINQRTLMVRENVLGKEHPDVAVSLNNIASIYSRQGRYEEALELGNRSLMIRKKGLGENHPHVAVSLNNIASVYSDQGLYDEALELHKRSLVIREKVWGPDHPDVASSLNNIASVYSDQGLYDEALELHKRSLVIREKVWGPDHPDVASSLNNIASVYSDQGLYDEALELHKRSLVIREKVWGPDHPDVALSLNNIAMVYSYQGRYEKALELLQRSLVIKERVFGLEHIGVALSLNNIAGIYSSQERHTDSLELYQRSLVIRKKVFDLNHPDVASGHSNIAFVLSDQGLHEEALEHLRRAAAIERRRFVGLGSKESKGLLSEQRDARWGFYKHVDLALHPEQTGVRAGLDREAFEVLQLAGTSSAGSALAQMAVRFASGSDAVSDLVRQRQDAEHQFEALDGNLVKAISAATNKRNDILIGNLRRQLGDTKTQIEALDREIEEKFPEYAALTSREPLSVRDVQKLLGQDEALLTFTRSWERDKTHVFVVRQKGLTVYTVDVGLDELRKSVDTLRSSLDLSVVGSLGSLPPFDTTVAFELYDKLLGPAAPALEGVKHLFVVPTGPLQSLPLGVLVTRRPATSGPDVPANDNGNRLQTRGLVTVPGKEVPVVEADNRVLAARYGHYRDVPWLAKRYALTTLPTVASLKSLRTFAKRSKASKPFAGFGDPVLDGNAGRNKGVEITAMFRGALANVDEVRKLSRLPDTADELRSMAQYLGADDGSVFLGSRATEAQVKQMNLSDRRVVAFSTHGLISGELKYLAEPALVLTPPDKATDQDDGLLAASEIAQLKLDADWVILSACNTAHADKPGAQGLTGLAKAFFYAGSRALLVSHWPVESRSATALTEDLFREFEQNPDIGRAEALRRSMLNVAANDNHPQWAHPAYWAPFVVVGEGLRR